MDYKIIGLMSGTSLDGLDMAFVHFYPASDVPEAGWNYTILCAESIPYSAEWREKLRGAYYRTAEGIAALDAEYGRYLGRCVKEFADKHRLERVDFVASHGHTVFHRPDIGYNLQIGNGAHLHAVSGFKVICDFRTLDIAFGGQGAPLVPIGDQLLFGQYDYCLNIGGFANVSFDDAAGRRIAYDLCPANYCLNRLMRTRGFEYDKDGQTARSGNVNPALLEALNALEYYHRPAPKSLAQEWVDACVTPLVEACSDSFENKMATLVEHAAFQIARPFAQGVQVLVTGGGAYNTYLLERAAAYGCFTWIRPDNAVIDFKEALIFAFLGLRRAEKLPNCLRSVTGASQDVASGQIYG
ncbi:MAG: anhydro-N-acetylmuramic acid kinase [Dysgonamonadaceae bacterium]|jgi:anhydro-N-acetylmuramic acid kinase|nr:anhydro-N-acetylmuramic acid kinase [Dysgonamonadaceae bacterium]